MSDFNSLRLKKKAELQNALTNVRKDLYEWKSLSNTTKNTFKPVNKQLSSRETMNISTSVRLKSLDSPGRPLSSKRSESLVDLTHSAKKAINLNQIVNRPQSDKFEKNEKNIEYGSNEFLTNFGEDRVYLNSARNNTRIAPRASQKELDNELVKF
jgi:hypothetical protein